jgi:TonB-linked outer membrane protein, SusC/RagA family
MKRYFTPSCGLLLWSLLLTPPPLKAQLLAHSANDAPAKHIRAPKTERIALPDALRSIERTYGISIAYRSGLLDGYLVAADAIERPDTDVETLMRHLLSPAKLGFKHNGNNFYIIYREEARQQLITGKVSDESGNPIGGVSVTAKGTTVSVGTDNEGRYQIAVPQGVDSLVFHFVGYADAVRAIGSENVIDVQLTSGQTELSEVVVTAAGIERKSSTLGYAVSTVSAENLAQKNEPDPIRALTGKVAGVNIQGGGGVAGGSTNITIRGNSSLGNNNQPLYVVDGIPFDNSTFGTPGGTQGNQATANRAFDLDPNNIQSITVLKGAAAAALYGSRAANGAIIVTTKASAKRSRKGTEITLNTSYSMEEIAGLPDYQHLYGQGTNFDYRLGVYGSSGSAYSSRDSVPHPLAGIASPIDFPEFYLADGETPAMVPYRSYAGKAQRDFFRTGGVLETALSINSGSEKGNFTVGLSRTANEGIVPGNDITRTSMSVGGNVRMDNKFYASGTINYVMTDQTSPPLGNGMSDGSIMANLYYLPTSYDLSGLPYETPGGDNVYARAGLDNPYWSVQHSPSTSNVDRYYGNFVLGFDPLEWLNIQNSVGFNAYTDRRLSVLGKGSSVYANGSMTADNIYRQELDNTLLVTITKDFAADYSVRAIFGNNINQRMTQRSVFNGDNIITRGIHDISNTSTITLGTLPNNRAKVKQRYYAFFGDITVDYKDYLSVNLVGRNDVSSTLPKENRSYFYGGVNGSFNFTNAFGISNKWLSSGTVRAGYTRVGNEASPYLTTNVYNANQPVGGLGAPFSNGAVSNVSTITLANDLTNPNLRPEFITEFEAGTELQFFNRRLVLDVTYYNKRSTSQIFTVDSPPSTGYVYRIINLGQTSNKGVEVMFSATPFRSGTGLTWDINANFTHNENMVDDLGEYALLVYGNNVHIPGQPYGQIYRSRYARDDEGNILVNPQTGKPIAAGTSGPVGNPNPRFMFGLSNSLSYKGVTMDLLFDWKEGGALYSANIGEAMARGVTRDTEDRELLYIAPGVLGDVNTLEPLLDENGNKIPNNTAIPVIDYYFSGGYGPGGIAEGSVFDATVFRLRELSLGYSLPQKLLGKTPFGSVFISVSARNLWYYAPNFPKYMNYDPEISTGGANNAGEDSYGVPTTRRYGVNLRFSF